MPKEVPESKICKHCGTQIPYAAKVCPLCRKRQKPSGCLIAVLVVVVLFVLLIVAGVAGSGSSDAQKVGEVSQNSAAQPAQQSTQTAFYVGDVFTAENVRITYVSSGEYQSSNQFIQPAEGNKFISISLYCENIGSTDQAISAYSFNCFADGYSCEQQYMNDDMLSATMSPGRSTSGTLVYEVPQNASEIEIEYEYNVISEKKVTFVYEGQKDSGFVASANTASSENAFRVGDVVEKSGMVITFKDCGAYQSTNQFIQPSEGNKFIYCSFEFENTSSSDEFVSSFDFDCFADGVSCKSSYMSDDQLSATLSAGRKTEGKVYFEVPVSASTIEVEYVANFWTSDRVVFAYSE